MIPVEGTIRVQFRWFGHVYWMKNERLAKGVSKTRSMEKEETRGIKWEKARTIAKGASTPN